MSRMISTIILFLLFLSASAFAEITPFRMICMTEFPTTSIVAETEGHELIVRVVHHNGMKFMPLHTGIMTPNDLNHFAQKASLFAKLGDHYEFRWGTSKCTRQDQDLFTCDLGKETVINGTKVYPFSVFTKRVTIESQVGKYENLEIGFMIDIEKSSQSFSMRYDKSECFQELK